MGPFDGSVELLVQCRHEVELQLSATGAQKLIDFEDEKKMRIFYEKRMGAEVEVDTLGDEWKGYVVRVAGGNDKQGFPMKQGILTAGRVRLLFTKGHSCYRERRTGERKRKSVRGCIVDANLSVLALVIVKKGEAEIPGLTDVTIPKRLGPKRASKIRRLVTPVVLQRKRHRIALKKRRAVARKDAAADYAKLLAMRTKEAKMKRQEELKRRRSRSQSKSSIGTQ